MTETEGQARNPQIAILEAVKAYSDLRADDKRFKRDLKDADKRGDERWLNKLWGREGVLSLLWDAYRMLKAGETMRCGGYAVFRKNRETLELRVLRPHSGSIVVQSWKIQLRPKP